MIWTSAFWTMSTPAVTEPVHFIDALWQAADVIQSAHDEHGPLPDTVHLTPDEAHRLRVVGCLALAEALHDGLRLLTAAA